MTTFVLIHGGWHGGWCWARVTPVLRAAGHEVYAPSLTGMGDRAHLLNLSIGLETHIEDVLGVLYFEGLRNVVLVGHSYGGMVITGVAERAAKQPSHLVYLDVFVPRDGQCLLDLLPVERAEAFREQALSVGEGWRIPAPPCPGPISPAPCQDPTYSHGSPHRQGRTRPGDTASYRPDTTRW